MYIYVILIRHTVFLNCSFVCVCYKRNKCVIVMTELCVFAYKKFPENLLKFFLE